MAKRGEVCVGKYGRRIGQYNLDLCSDRDNEVYLLLAQSGAGEKHRFYIARLSQGQNVRPAKLLIPEYYRSRTDIHTWLLIKEPLKEIPQKEVNRWVIRSSGMPLIETMQNSMAGYFIAVKKGSGLVRAVRTPTRHREGSKYDKNSSLSKDFDSLTFDDFISDIGKDTLA